MLQGQNRLQRGINFVAYLAEVRADGRRPPNGLFYGGHDSLAFLAMGEYVIKCRFQSNRTQRYIRLHMSLSAFR